MNLDIDTRICSALKKEKNAEVLSWLYINLSEVCLRPILRWEVELFSALSKKGVVVWVVDYQGQILKKEIGITLGNKASLSV